MATSNAEPLLTNEMRETLQEVWDLLEQNGLSEDMLKPLQSELEILEGSTTSSTEASSTSTSAVDRACRCLRKIRTVYVKAACWSVSQSNHLISTAEVKLWEDLVRQADFRAEWAKAHLHNLQQQPPPPQKKQPAKKQQQQQQQQPQSKANTKTKGAVVDPEAALHDAEQLVQRSVEDCTKSRMGLYEIRALRSVHTQKLKECKGQDNHNDDNHNENNNNNVKETKLEGSRSQQ